MRIQLEKQNRINKRKGLPIEEIPEPEKKLKEKKDVVNEIIEAQGDISSTLVDFLVQQYNIPINCISIKQ